MTTPTLAEFASALFDLFLKHPDAPQIPVPYAFDDDNEGRCRILHGRVYLPDEAALALCVVTAMEIGAWWNETHDTRCATLCPIMTSWHFDVWDDGRCVDEGDFDALPAAALAMLRAIGDAK